MKNKKKIIAALSIICILALAAGTAAYKLVSGTAKSTVKASNLKVELIMLEDDGNGETPVSDSINILPGETKSRIAKVKNIGSEPAWVRVDCVVETHHGTEFIEEFGYITLGHTNTHMWSHHDGYWYYKVPLEPGETTESVFEEVSFTDDINTKYSGKDINMKVIAQGTQTKHNGEDALSATGWPED